jgi:CRP-like cAMP-binding protein
VAQLDAVASATGASRTSLLEALMRTRKTLDDLSNETKEAQNVFITSSKGGESYHSTPQRIYDQIAELRKERTEDGKRRYPVSHIDRLAEFYALVKKNYGWVSNSPAELSRKQIADVFDCSLDTASDLVEVARKTGFVFAERNNYTKNGKTTTKGYLITLRLRPDQR